MMMHGLADFKFTVNTSSVPKAVLPHVVVPSYNTNREVLRSQFHINLYVCYFLIAFNLMVSFWVETYSWK